MKNIDIHSLLNIIGQNLHTIRNARKETLQAVATEIGVTHPIISKIENGRYESLQLGLLVKLCNHYQITLQQAFSLEVANIFQLTQHNSQSGNHKLVGQELAAGYELYIDQLVKENNYLKEQSQKLLEKLEK